MASIYDSLGVLLTRFGNLELFELKGRLLKLLIWSNESQVTNKIEKIECMAHIEYGPYYMSPIFYHIVRYFWGCQLGKTWFAINSSLLESEKDSTLYFSVLHETFMSRAEIHGPGRTRTSCVEPCLSAKSPSKEACMTDSIYLWQKIIDNQLKIRG